MQKIHGDGQGCKNTMMCCYWKQMDSIVHNNTVQIQQKFPVDKTVISFDQAGTRKCPSSKANLEGPLTTLDFIPT